MPESIQCPQCGAPLPTGWPKGLCSRCALQGALELSDAASQVPHPADFPAPSTSGPPAAPVPLGTLKYFGDYELLEEIARGGMGIVYKARQKSLDRIVAVKMLLLGQYASEEFVHRFRLEASAAASLQHPNIVAIHEVGVHQGQHYFAMDFVEGPNLAQLVRDQPLSAQRAARYVKTIAEAIHFAHTRHILHRDLKPSNVLIDANDQPHVTDFGLAKKLSDDSDLTVTGQVLGSPSFLPPEQALGERGKMGPASDVYSLGAILYHALTGRPPFVGQTVADTLKQVETSDPVAPCLLIPTIPADLETICLKCLEKEPAKRYPTAQELADELGRFRNGEPIRARPVSVVGKVHRWCLRNKPLAVTGTAILALLLVVAIGSPIALIRINRARVQAQTETAKSKQVAQFLKDMLAGVGPAVALGQDTKMLRGILDKTAKRLGQDLTSQPEVEAELRNTLGEVYSALGEWNQAEGMYRQALALRKRLFGEEHLDVAASLNDLADVLSAQRNNIESEAMARNALAIRTNLLGVEHPAVATSLDSIASALYRQNRWSEAEAVAREGLAMRRKLLSDTHPDVGLSLGTLVWVLKRQGKIAEAEPLAREALEIYRNQFGNEHPQVARSIIGLAALLLDQGKLPEAETLNRDAVAQFRKFFGDGHPELCDSLILLAVVLFREGKLSESEVIFREWTTMRQKQVLSAPDGADAAALYTTIWVLATSDDGALRDGQRAIQFAEKAVLLSQRKKSGFLQALAAAYAEAGQFDKAVLAQREAAGLQRDANSALECASRLAHYRAEKPLRDSLRLAVANSLEATASYSLGSGGFAEAEKPARNCLALREEELPDDWRTFISRSRLGGSLLGQKKYAEAESALRSACEGMKRREDEMPPCGGSFFKETIQRLVQLYEATGQPDKAAEWNQKLSDQDKIEAAKPATPLQHRDR